MCWTSTSGPIFLEEQFILLMGGNIWHSFVLANTLYNGTKEELIQKYCLTKGPLGMVNNCYVTFLTHHHQSKLKPIPYCLRRKFA